MKVTKITQIKRIKLILKTYDSDQQKILFN